MFRGITLSCGCRVQLILSGLPKDFGSLSEVIIDGNMIQPCYDHDPERKRVRS